MIDKIILVFYINTNNLPTNDVSDYIDEIIKMLHDEEEEKKVKKYFIPIDDGESRIECINPKVITPDEYKRVEKVLEEMETRMEASLKYHFIYQAPKT